MQKEHTNKPKSGIFKWLSGALIGGIIGSAAGILFAPKKGSATRKFLKDKSEYIGKHAKSAFQKIKEWHKTCPIRNKITGIIEKLKKNK